jgi:glucan phosphorylase
MARHPVRKEPQGTGKPSPENIRSGLTVEALWRAYQVRNSYFSPENPNLFKPLVDNLMKQDEYTLFADFAAYTKCQAKVATACRDADHWTRMSILNTAHMGRFSSDRATREYCRDIWKAEPVRVDIPGRPGWKAERT